jgi:hypothetical protein
LHSQPKCCCRGASFMYLHAKYDSSSASCVDDWITRRAASSWPNSEYRNERDFKRWSNDRHVRPRRLRNSWSTSCVKNTRLLKLNTPGAIAIDWGCKIRWHPIVLQRRWSTCTFS